MKDHLRGKLDDKVRTRILRAHIFCLLWLILIYTFFVLKSTLNPNTQAEAQDAFNPIFIPSFYKNHCIQGTIKVAAYTGSLVGGAAHVAQTQDLPVSPLQVHHINACLSVASWLIVPISIARLIAPDTRDHLRLKTAGLETLPAGITLGRQA
jgi:hypothetical protein